MRSGVFEYNGYVGSAEVDPESKTLFGKLLFIKDVITYCANGVFELEAAFKEAVDDYLQTCKELGDVPDVPCKGTFNVRVGPDVHRDVALAARRLDIGLNDFVCKALVEAVNENSPRMVEHRHHHDVRVTLQSSTLTATSSQQSTRWESIGGTTLQH